MALEVIGMALGIVGFEAVLRWPGTRWALIPWLLADCALLIHHGRAYSWPTAGLFAYYLVRTMFGMRSWGRAQGPGRDKDR